MQSAQSKTLRPHTVLELVDHTFRIYRDSFTKFVAPVAVVTVPITVITLISSYALTNNLSSTRTVGRSAAELNQMLNGVFSSTLLLLGVILVLQFIQGVVVNSVLTYLASERHLGRSVTIGEAFTAAKSRFLSVGVGLLLFYILVGAVTFGLSFVFFFCFGLAIPALIWLGVSIYAFLVPVLTLERTGITEGMNRAWALAKARFWPVFGFSMAVGLIYFLIYLALLTFALLVRGTVTGASFGAAQIIQTLLQAIVGIFLTPILPIGFTVLYYDTRVRLEGLDIALDSLTTPEPRPSDLVSPPPVGPTFTRTDLTNILILLAVCVVVVVVVIGIGWLAVRGSTL